MEGQVALQLAERQKGFARSLLDPERAAPIGLLGPDGICSARRYGVYRNNVVVGLADAIALNFPAVRRIVGEEFFRALAVEFVRVYPPNSPVLLGYGARFAEFLEGFPPVAQLPYLPDVARIEHAWIESYNAADADALTVESLAFIKHESLAHLQLELHPSLRLVQSRYPAFTIWEMNGTSGEPAPVDLGLGGEAVLVVRPEAEVIVQELPLGGAEFIEALADGQTVVTSALRAVTVTPHFELVGVLAGLVSSGAIAGFRNGNLMHASEGGYQYDRH